MTEDTTMIQSRPLALVSPAAGRRDGGFPASTLVRRIRRWWSARQTIRAVAALGDDRLADIGVDRSVLTGPRPVHVVERGYHAKASGWR